MITKKLVVTYLTRGSIEKGCERMDKSTSDKIKYLLFKGCFKKTQLFPARSIA